MKALHVNYGLRGAESEADERHCVALCVALGVELEVVRAHRDGGEAGNLQAWARDVRYGAATELAEELDEHPWTSLQVRSGQRALVAAGHTASDQVETILYRLAASPGRRALLGMRAVEGRWSVRCSVSRARRPASTAELGGSSGARMRATTVTRTRAHACVTGW